MNQFRSKWTNSSSATNATITGGSVGCPTVNWKKQPMNRLEPKATAKNWVTNPVSLHNCYVPRIVNRRLRLPRHTDVWMFRDQPQQVPFEVSCREVDKGFLITYRKYEKAPIEDLPDEGKV